jgi:hypothetical protein
MSRTIIEKGEFNVDEAARRFGDESIGYSGFTRALLAEGSPEYIVRDPHGRPDFRFDPPAAPYAICQVVPGLFHTQVDADRRPLRPSREPVPSLLSGGGGAPGISGLAGARGYCSGNGLLAAVGLGRPAGSAAATEARRAQSRSPRRAPEPKGIG